MHLHSLPRGAAQPRARIGAPAGVRYRRSVNLAVVIPALDEAVLHADTRLDPARRCLANGVWRTLGRHWLAAAWGLGVDRDRIARWVRR